MYRIEVCDFLPLPAFPSPTAVERERKRERGREGGREGGRERERGRESVCVCARPQCAGGGVRV